MTTIWKDGGRRGEIVSDEGDFICIVQTVRIDSIKVEPWPEGEAHFRLILNAPQTLEALEAVLEKVERMMQHPDVPVTWLCVCAAMRREASVAIAAAKGEGEK